MNKKIISKFVKIVKVKVVCMDCGITLKEGPNGRVSHGICPACDLKREKELDDIQIN